MPVREAASKPAAPATEAAPRGPAVQSEAPVSVPPRHADASGRPAGVSGAPEAPAPVPAQAQPPLPALPEPVAPAQVAAATAASSSAKDSKTEPQAAVPSAAVPPQREPPPAAASAEAQPAPPSATDSRGKTASTAAANTAPATGRDAALAKLTQELRQVGSLVLDRPDSGADATAQLEVHYASGGYISSIVIAQSSGSPALDDQALGYARAMRLPNAPQELRGQEFVVSFPIVFRGR